MIKKKLLIFSPLKFYSNEDEELFFNWIKKIKCISAYKGVGRELHVTVNSDSFSFNDFRNLRGLFKRYQLDKSEQLKNVFKNKDNEEWFDDN